MTAKTLSDAVREMIAHHGFYNLSPNKIDAIAAELKPLLEAADACRIADDHKEYDTACAAYDQARAALMGEGE